MVTNILARQFIMTFKMLLLLVFIYTQCSVVLAQEYSFSIDEKQKRISEILQTAFQTTSQTDIISSIKITVNEKYTGNPLYSIFQEYQIYRKTGKDGVQLTRMEMTGKENKYDAFAVKNQNGSFIVFEKTNKAMECMDISMFHCFDSLSNPIQKNEMLYSQYVLDDLFFNGEQCWKIQMQIPDGLNDSQLDFILDYVHCRDQNIIQNQRPFFREYIIGKNTSLIHSLKTFNSRGLLLFSFELVNPETSIDWSGKNSLFDTPDNIFKTVSTEQAAFEIAYDFDHTQKRKSSSSVLLRYFSDMTKYISESLAQQICLLVGIGVILVGAGVWIRMKRK